MAHPSMDRRLRSPSSSRRSSPRAGRDDDERSSSSLHHRFLRPGALARLRDSKIIARSLRTAASASSPVRLLPPSSPPPSLAPPASAAEDGVGGAVGAVPHFFGGLRGMRYPLRKKLVAARSVVFLPPPASPDAAEVFFDAFTAGLVHAH